MSEFQERIDAVQALMSGPFVIVACLLIASLVLGAFLQRRL